MSGGGEALVVGGGVIGLSCAWELARAGTRVRVLDPEPTHGASWVAGGMLAPVAEAWAGEEDLLRLGLASSRAWPTFASTLGEQAGTDVGFTTRGTLVVARDADEAAELTQLHDLHTAWDLPSERLSGREARRVEPALHPTVRGALWLAQDHQVDNRRLLAALTRAAEAAGVVVDRRRATAVEGAAVTVAASDEDTEHERLVADTVVVATGAWTLPIRPGPGGAEHPLRLPVRPVKGQILRVRGTATAVLPTHTVRAPGIYVIPRAHGEIAIGATAEDRGFDTTVTAGGVRELLHEAWQLVPGLDETELLEAVAGLRPGTPDNRPLVGRLVDVPEVVVATGHYRNGILLAPVTARLVRDLVTGGDGEPGDGDLLAACDPARLDRREVSV